ncbi:MAG: phosphohydrolase [Chloroflexi bacterium]|nr:phosphohydrolase [Chloroflexota bacterium]
MFESRKCPGQDSRNLSVDTIKCPNCGFEEEIWSNELRVKCGNCQQWTYKEQGASSCLDWCPMAKDCIGPEKWQELRGFKDKKPEAV